MPATPSFRRFSIIKIAVFLAVFLIGGSVVSFYELFSSPGDFSEAKTVIIEKGSSLYSIASYLKKEGLIESASVFTIGARTMGKGASLRSGEYSIPPRASPKMIVDILTSGQTVIRRVTIPEGLTSEQIVLLLNAARGLTGEVKEIPPNGTLLPETYVYSYGDKRESIMKRMADGMTKTLQEVFAERESEFLTPDEVIILASIVERETALPLERPRIASVFLNRIKKGMPLQTDPTVIYAVTDGIVSSFTRKLTLDDLRYEHPYNTYRNRGLPPGPICNPGKDSILAVLYPDTTNDLFFVADGTGGHSFSETFDSHKKNVRTWRRINRRKSTPAKGKGTSAPKKSVTPSKAAPASTPTVPATTSKKK